jgi:hypothetical protein
MYTLIIIFYISLLGIISLLLWKRHELRTGYPSLFSRLGHSTDHTFHMIFAHIRHGLSYVNRRTFVALVQWAAFHVLYWVRKAYVEIKHRTLMNPHGKKLIDAVRGRGEVTDHGASFYLRRIAKERNNQ